jgi:hypothetical protein
VSTTTGEEYYLNIWTSESQYEFPAQPVLPTGWTLAKSTTTGEDYYIDTATGDSTFDYPSAPTATTRPPVRHKSPRATQQRAPGP